MAVQHMLRDLVRPSSGKQQLAQTTKKIRWLALLDGFKQAAILTVKKSKSQSEDMECT